MLHVTALVTPLIYFEDHGIYLQILLQAEQDMTSLIVRPINVIQPPTKIQNPQLHN